MMPRVILAVCMAATFTVGSGCLRFKSYVDADAGGANYSLLRRPASPKPVALAVEFQTNGKKNARGVKVVRPQVERILRASGLVTMDPGNEGAGKMTVVVNNVGNLGKAAVQGAATGLTLGAAGSRVVDGYELRAVYQPPGGSATYNKQASGRLVSTIGLKSAPPGMTEVPLVEGVNRILEDMLIKVLIEFQRDGTL